MHYRPQRSFSIHTRDKSSQYKREKMIAMTESIEKGQKYKKETSRHQTWGQREKTIK